MPEEEKTSYGFQDIDVFIKNAADRVEVAVTEGNYYEDYVAEHVKDHFHETKILAALATHFRGQGFRVKIYQSEGTGYGAKKYSFLRIAWNYNPYHYPEESPSKISSLLSFLPFGKRPGKPKLFGAGLAAYQKVKAGDTLTAVAIRLLEEVIDKCLVTGKKPVVKKQELKTLLQEKAPHHPLRKLDTQEIIRHFEKKGLSVKVNRFFQFEFTG